jgi:serine/threonine-protein kinase SRPK3
MESPAEDITKYSPGGYHPVHLGDCFNDGQYKVIDKLGFGSFSTVWLARDLQYVLIS